MKSKIFLTVIESVLFIIMLCAVILNFNAGTTSQFSVSLTGNYLVLNTMFVVLLFYLIGLFSGFAYSIVLGERYKSQISFYARKNEKLSQQNEIDSDDKEVLQRKIASLEIALDNALKNKN